MSTAILLPGSASTSHFVRRAFPEILADHDIAQWAPTGGDAATMAEQLAQFAAGTADEPTVVIGVSIGAHAAALWASELNRADTRLLLALPAWTGPPSPVAAMTETAAHRIETYGLSSELQRLTALFPDDWVTKELVLAWSAVPPEDLASTLRATATSTAPTIDQLSTITMPTLVLGLHNDPMHPWPVAQQWAQAIPHAELVGLDRSAPQSDLAAFGRACVTTAWAKRGSGKKP